MSLRIEKCDILDLDVDVIVNSANPSLLAGGGVCGAIHRAAGPELEAAARPLGPLKPGEAVLTPGFNLKAKFVIHAVAPRYMRGLAQAGESSRFIQAGLTEDQQLRSAYRSALELASELEGVSSIAFPSMGTGIYRWPLKEAAFIAVSALRDSTLEQTIMCVRDDEAFNVYRQQLDDLDRVLQIIRPDRKL
jgi:O-acetyl-ADP-ribose deacetylase (regulator of RNase III)